MPLQRRNAVAPTAPGEYHHVRSGPTLPEASPQLDPECDDREFNDTLDALEDALRSTRQHDPPVSAGDPGAAPRGGQNTASGRRRRVTKKIVVVIGIATIIAALRLTLRMSEGYQEIILTMVGLAFLVIVDGLDYRDKKRVLEKNTTWSRYGSTCGSPRCWRSWLQL